MKYVATTISLILLISTFAFGNEYNIGDRIKTNNFYKESYDVMFGKKAYAHLPTFYKTLGKSKWSKKKNMDFVEQANEIFPPKILMPLTYWKRFEKNEENVATVLSYYMLYKFLILRDYIDDPLNPERNVKAVQDYLVSFSGISGVNSENLFSKLYPEIKKRAQKLSSIKSEKRFFKALKSDNYIAEEPGKKFDFLPDYVLSFYGIVPGNKVEIISENDSSEDRIKWLNDISIIPDGKLKWGEEYMVMPTKTKPIGHLIFMNDPIFIKIRDMIDSAKESVFIDIFLFGGTMGAVLSQYLIDKTLEYRKSNPNFSTIILHDYATNYNMKNELMPVFQYIKDRIDSDPKVAESVFLLQANIHRHPPGIPFGITNVLPKENDEFFKKMEQGNTYFESKIDHSKVIVVDGKSKSPQAYFGSKNWTDHSGGYYFDDAIYVNGPAATLVQDSYVGDVDAALTLDPKEQRLFYYKEDGFDNRHLLPKRDKIISLMSVNPEQKVKKEGQNSLRIAEADVDGKIKNARNILIDMISKAENYIYMEQLFIYDKYINDALIKRKIENPRLDIRILADHNGNFEMNGFPNTMFIAELAKNRIQIKARRTLGVYDDKTDRTYHQENHRKATVVDGKYFLGGSSNLNPDTLQGSFREFGAEIFSRLDKRGNLVKHPSIARFEKDFLTAWNDNDLTMPLDIRNFQLKIKDKEFSVQLSHIFNKLASLLVRSKDYIEQRF